MALCKMKEDYLVVKVPRELDHHAAADIRENTDQYFVNKMVKYVIFDFSDTQFMDSSGIGLIMGRYKQVINLRGKVYVCGINDSVNKIFELSGLYRLVNREENLKSKIEW